MGNENNISNNSPREVLRDRYRIKRLIHRFGDARAMYKAIDTVSDSRICTVIELDLEKVKEAHRPEKIEYLKHQADVLAQLSHPRIPELYEYFTLDNKHYLVTSWIGEEDLEDYRISRAGCISEEEITDVGVQVCEVLDYLHSRHPSIIHRNIKPTNVYLNYEHSGGVIVTGFGLALFRGCSDEGVRAAGTMGYIAPESFAGKNGPQSDIYSLGATMFHLLTGMDPYDNPLLIFDFTKNPRPSQINPYITEEMDRILTTAVAFKPEDRFASAASLMYDLQHLRTLSQPILCPSCGSITYGLLRFCRHCGKEQPSGPRPLPRQIVDDTKTSVLDTSLIRANPTIYGLIGKKTAPIEQGTAKKKRGAKRTQAARKAPAVVEYEVFISYRRDSDAIVARALAAELRQRNIKTFLDVDDLGPGRFSHELLDRIETTPSFVVILSANALDRCADEKDWLRQEIGQAIKSGKKVIPVLMPGFDFPEFILPRELCDLPTFQSLKFSHDYFQAMVSKIISYLQK